MSYAETIILDIRIGQVPVVVSALTGRDGLGVWVSEIGVLNRVVLFRTADTYAGLLDGRPELLAAIPKDAIQSVDVTSWRLISPLLPAGAHGGVYEWRCYEMKLGQVGDVEEAFVALSRHGWSFPGWSAGWCLSKGHHGWPISGPTQT